MSWFHGASHLSQVPWREVEGHYSPGYEPCEELLAEIQRSAETDAGEDPAEDEQADNVTFGHKMMYPAEPDWNVTSDDFADEDLASLLRGDGKKKIDLVASMHMLKLVPDRQTG